MNAVVGNLVGNTGSQGGNEKAPHPAFRLVRGQCAPEGIRTPNLLIRSQMLYPLSYGRLSCCGATGLPFARPTDENITACSSRTQTQIHACRGELRHSSPEARSAI
jgi:hypothetical protein